MNSSPAVTPPASGNVRVSRVVLLVVGSIVTLVALGLLIAGGVLGWAHAFERDSDGYLTTHAQRLRTPTYALTSGRSISARIPSTRTSMSATSPPSGSARRPRGCSGVRRHRPPARRRPVPAARRARRDRRRRHLRRRPPRRRRALPPDPGTVTPAPPADQTFWDASASGRRHPDRDVGPAVRQLVGGRHERERRAGVTVDASIGAKADWLLPAAIALLIAGAIVAAPSGS